MDDKRGAPRAFVSIGGELPYPKRGRIRYRAKQELAVRLTEAVTSSQPHYFVSFDSAVRRSSHGKRGGCEVLGEDLPTKALEGEKRYSTQSGQTEFGSSYCTGRFELLKTKRTP